MLSHFLTTLAIIFVAIGQPSLLVGAEDNLAVDIITSNGNRIQMPFFMANMTTINPELRECLVKDTEEVIGLLGTTLDARLRAKGSAFASIKGGLVWANLAGQMTLLARSQDARRRKLGDKRRAGTKGSYNKAMQSLFADLMLLSKEEAKKLKGTPKEPELLADELSIFLSDLVEAIQSSPVASYFKWSEATINGVNFVDYASKKMAKLSHNGYGAVFKSIELLLSLLVTFSG